MAKIAHALLGILLLPALTTCAGIGQNCSALRPTQSSTSPRLVLPQQGHTVKPIAPDAQNWVTCRAQAGDRVAQYQLGQHFESPGGAQDFIAAASWYKRAAAPDSGQTMIYMAPVGGQKFGSVSNISTGTASPGLAQAQYALGLLYAEGRGVKQNDKKAQQWFGRAARQGNAQAQSKLEVQ